MKLEIIGLGADGKKTVCTGVEMFRKILDEGQAGDNVGLLLWYRQRRDQTWYGIGKTGFC